jgi:hypothetical protein
MKNRWTLVALGVVAAATLAVTYVSYAHEDAFTAKYRLIRKGTTPEDAVRLLGPWHTHMGSSSVLVYTWNSLDHRRAIDVTWNCADEVICKSLVDTRDGSVILSDPPHSWWDRFLKRVGLR